MHVGQKYVFSMFRSFCIKQNEIKELRISEIQQRNILLAPGFVGLKQNRQATVKTISLHPLPRD